MNGYPEEYRLTFKLGVSIYIAATPDRRISQFTSVEFQYAVQDSITRTVSATGKTPALSSSDVLVFSQRDGGRFGRRVRISLSASTLSLREDGATESFIKVGTTPH